MASYKGYLPKELLMAGLTTMVAPDQLPARVSCATGSRDNRDLTAAGLRPNALQTTPWDAGLLIVDALRHVGPNATASQVREYLAEACGVHRRRRLLRLQENPQRGVDWKSSQF